jgi:transposase-like protein
MNCPKCGSHRIVKAGFNRNKKFNYDKQRWVCMSCHRFTIKPIGLDKVINNEN